jgi:hypothetical protein
MLTVDQKKAQCLSFIGSDKFGLDTWVTMTAFIENIRNVISTMRLYYDLINKLDQEFLSRVLPDQQMRYYASSSISC